VATEQAQASERGMEAGSEGVSFPWVVVCGRQNPFLPLILFIAMIVGPDGKPYDIRVQ
jgi:hypothetical protein